MKLMIASKSSQLTKNLNTLVCGHAVCVKAMCF